MNLQPVGSTYAAYNIQCCKCGEFKPGPEMLADLDGKAFEDYYCQACGEIDTALRRIVPPLDRHQSLDV